MKGSVLIPSSKAGFLLFVLLQTSLILYASAQFNSTNTTDSSVSINSNMTSEANQTVNATNSVSGTNGTAMVSCKAFACNSSACINLFTSINVTTCSGSDKFCELRRDGDALYSVRCTSTCLSTCTNTSQNNCSLSCCSDNNCVNSTLNKLNSVIMTTISTTANTATTTKSSTVASTTMANNGKKCHTLSCNGDNCYQGKDNVGLCAPGQNFCMLKKTSAVTVITWTASCVADCSKETVCASSNTNCILECCNATTTASCLKMNGQLNILGSSGTMASCSHVPLVVSSFLVWLLMMGKSTK